LLAKCIIFVRPKQFSGGVKKTAMKKLGIKKITLSSPGYDRIRETSTPDEYNSLEVEVWEGDKYSFPEYAVINGAPEGQVYCRVGWEHLYERAMSFIAEKQLPKGFTKKNGGRLDSASSLMEALKNGKTPESWSEKMKYYYPDQFGVVRTEKIVNEIRGEASRPIPSDPKRWRVTFTDESEGIVVSDMPITVRTVCVSEGYYWVPK
jgi:hypothetical protein